ncbi:hypothetical protein F4778DRAFT_528886 [Xylariomycetidae sp. FL2044]|nr:hypothetical protein F4778DRAFT_528886 [Xylariomycetidae sp. FL2044]
MSVSGKMDTSYYAIILIKNSPALAPPPGKVPNFDNPPHNNKTAIIVISICMILAAIAFVIRAYTRLFRIKRVRLEDYLALLSWPFFIASCCILIRILRTTGFFVNQWNVLIKDLEEFIADHILATTLYCVAILLTKTAILVEWTHLFVPLPQRNPFFYICYLMIWANACLYIATIIIINYACNPRERIWSRYLPGTCININAFNLFITSFHLVFDLFMLLLPHKVIWQLSLTTKQKMGVSVIFSVGILTCACADNNTYNSNTAVTTTSTDAGGFTAWKTLTGTKAAWSTPKPTISTTYTYLLAKSFILDSGASWQSVPLFMSISHSKIRENMTTIAQ